MECAKMFGQRSENGAKVFILGHNSNWLQLILRGLHDQQNGGFLSLSQHKDDQNAEILWRLARAVSRLSEIASVRKQTEFYDESYQYAAEALKLDENNHNVHRVRSTIPTGFSGHFHVQFRTPGFWTVLQFLRVSFAIGWQKLWSLVWPSSFYRFLNCFDALTQHNSKSGRTRPTFVQPWFLPTFLSFNKTRLHFTGVVFGARSTGSEHTWMFILAFMSCSGTGSH